MLNQVNGIINGVYATIIKVEPDGAVVNVTYLDSNSNMIVKKFVFVGGSNILNNIATSATIIS